MVNPISNLQLPHLEQRSERLPTPYRCRRASSALVLAEDQLEVEATLYPVADDCRFDVKSHRDVHVKGSTLGGHASEKLS